MRNAYGRASRNETWDQPRPCLRCGAPRRDSIHSDWETAPYSASLLTTHRVGPEGVSVYGFSFPNIEIVYSAVAGAAAVFARRSSNEILVACPSRSHEDRHPSCSLNSKKGVFYCHACCIGGGVLDLPIVAGLARDRAEAFSYLRDRRLLK